MGSQPVLIEEFSRKDQETGQEVKVRRFAPGKPRPGLITRLTAKVASDCDGCVYDDGTCMTELETGHDAPCMVEDEDRDSGSGRMFSNNL